MIRLNYKVDSNVVSKMFNSTEEAYKFAVDNIVTEADREYYKECCGRTFEDVGEDDLMMAVMKNAMEKVVLICKD